MRTGFSLIEALVALVLFEVGILALVASGTVAARQLADANRRTRARAAAIARVEGFRARACSAAGSGSANPAAGIAEFWRVDAGSAAHVITDSVEYQLPGGHSSHVVLHGWTLCPQ